MERLHFLVTWYLPGIFLLAIFLGGIVLAAMSWRRHPMVSFLTLIALTLATIRFVVHPLVFDWLIANTKDPSWDQKRQLYWNAIQGVFNFFATVEIGLLLIAIFGWRTESPAMSGKAAASVVLGFLSLPLSLFAGIPAILLGILGLRDVKRSAGEMRGRGLAITGITVAIVAMLTPLLAFALIVPMVREEASKAQSVSNLANLALGMAMYNATQDHLPPPVLRGPSGHPYSWRVELLDYVEEHELSAQYNKNEPWDSPGNLEVLNHMPKVYAPPTGVGGNQTFYQVIVGPGTAFEGIDVPLNLKTAFGKDQASTLLIVEAKTSVPWTKPEDLTYKPGRPVVDLGGIFPRGFHVCFLDGKVRWIDKAELSQVGRWITRKK